MVKMAGWEHDPLWASIYDWMVNHPRAGGMLWYAGLQTDLRMLYRAIEEIGVQPPGSRVLDVPCGGGVALRGLRPGQGVSYLATDIAESMLARTTRTAHARGVGDQVNTQIADVGNLPFDTASFDLVVSFTGLHCFPDPARAVTEMLRVLRPGAVLTGSALLRGTGLRDRALWTIGARLNLLGPGFTGEDIASWLTERGCDRVELHHSGPLVYFRAVKQ
ncbi:MAG: class I SAM-dependent methyltransferase [Mycobacteriaceae bacterium]